ncbi:hypothetical protein BDF19DRAFT_423321 [Syncephalis fuscata]|nr:hypothetical protein BDF19DRAFT_423321 [Syncephalis fuscata]
MHRFTLRTAIVSVRQARSYSNNAGTALAGIIQRTASTALNARFSVPAIGFFAQRLALSAQSQRHFTEYKPNDWNCPSCDAHNFARRTTCWECGQPGNNTSKKYDHDWVCKDCNFKNFSSRQQCLRCKAEKSVSDSHRYAMSSSARTVRRTMPDRWTCSECKHSSHIAYSKCEACAYPRNRLQEMRDTEETQSRLVRQRNHDWLCGGCGSHNYISRINCRECGVPYDSTARAVTSVPDMIGTDLFKKPQ